MARSRPGKHNDPTDTNDTTTTRRSTIRLHKSRRPPRVIVIGAGMSGLTCARELKQRRYEVLVVEARDRCGGRVKADDFRHVDLGGALIHGIQGNPLYKLVDQMGFPLKSKSSCLLLDEKGDAVDAAMDQKVSRIFNDLLEQTFDQTRKRATTTTKTSLSNNNNNNNNDHDNDSSRYNNGVATALSAATTNTTNGTSSLDKKADTVVSNHNVDSSIDPSSSSQTTTTTTQSQSHDAAPLQASSSFGDVFDSLALPKLQKMTLEEQQLFDWHKANLEVSCGASFPKLGWRWNDDEPYGFGGAHMALQETSWGPVIEALQEGLDIWHKAPVKCIRIVKTTTPTPFQQQQQKEESNVTTTKRRTTTTSTTQTQQQQSQSSIANNNNDNNGSKRNKQQPQSNTTTKILTPKSKSITTTTPQKKNGTKRKCYTMHSGYSSAAARAKSTITTTANSSSTRSSRAAARATNKSAVSTTKNNNVRRSSRSTKGIREEKLTISFGRTLNYDEDQPPPLPRTTTPKATKKKKVATKKKKRILLPQKEKEEDTLLSAPPVQVQVTLENGTVLQADSVICTLPLGILKLPFEHPNSVQFIPPLPPEKTTAIQRLGCGLFNKCCLVFSYVFWQQHIQEEYDFWGVVGNKNKNQSGSSSNATMTSSLPTKTTTTTTTLSDNCSNSNCTTTRQQEEQRNYLIVVNPGTVDPVTGERSLPMLTFWFGGDFAKHVEEWTDEGIMKDCMETLETICGTGEVPPPLDYAVTRWGKETYSRGAFVYVPPGVDSDRELQTMSEPVFGEPLPKPPVRKTRSSVKLEDRPPPKPSILFAGEHTTPYHPSTIHGAYLSGLREAYRLDLANFPTMNQDLTFSKEAIYQRTFTVKRIIPKAKAPHQLSPPPSRVSSPSPKKKSNDAMQLRKRPKSTTNTYMPSSTPLNGTKKATTSSAVRHNHRRRNGVVVVQKRQSLVMPSRRSNRLTVKKEWEEHFRKMNGNNGKTLQDGGSQGGARSQQDVSLLRAVQSFGCTTQEGLRVIQEKTLPVFASTLTGISMPQEDVPLGKQNGQKIESPQMTTFEVEAQCLELLKSAAVINGKHATSSFAKSDGKEEVDNDSSNINIHSNNGDAIQPPGWEKWLAPEKDFVRDTTTTKTKVEKSIKSSPTDNTAMNGNHLRARSGRRIIPKKIMDM